jgi:hypothetical protein
MGNPIATSTQLKDRRLLQAVLALTSGVSFGAAPLYEVIALPGDSALTPIGALPPGYAVYKTATKDAVLGHTGKSISKTKWSGTGADGKWTTGMYAVSGGKLLADGGAALEKEERLAIWAERGAIDETAWDHFKSLSVAEALKPIGFFASTSGAEPFCEKGLGGDDKCAKAKAQVHAGRLAQAEKVIVAAGGTIEWANGPFFSGTAAPKQLLAVRHNPALSVLALAPKPPEPASLSTVWGDSVVGWDTGVYPTSVDVCLIEGYAPKTGSPWMDGLSFVDVRYPGGMQDKHANQMADILIGEVAPLGLAQGAKLYVPNWWYPLGIQGPQLPQAWWLALDYCREHQASVWNFSQYHPTGPDPLTSTPPTPVVEDRYFDWLALQPPFPTIVAAAGNLGTPKYAHNKLRNGMVVGGSQEGASQMVPDCSSYWPSPDRGQHTIWGMFGKPVYAENVGSQSVNPVTMYGDWELPHVVAPATNGCLRVAAAEPEKGTGGTSAATAMVSAGVAQLQEINPALKYWPEACKAIVLAAADEDVDHVPLNLTDAIDDRDGAGEINLGAQLVLGQPANRRAAPDTVPALYGYDYGTFAFLDPAMFLAPAGLSAPPGDYYHHYRVRSETSQQIRVVLVWNSTPTCDAPENCTANEAIVPDLDLYVVEGESNVPVAASESYDSNHEVIQFQAAAGVTYRVKISWRGGGLRSWYAVAWGPNDI